MRREPASARRIIAPQASQGRPSRANTAKRCAPRRVSPERAEQLISTIRETRIPAPPTNCLSPIGEERILASLNRELGKLSGKVAESIEKALMFVTGGLSEVFGVDAASHLKENAREAEGFAAALDRLAGAVQRAGVESGDSLRKIASERTQEAIRISNDLLGWRAEYGLDEIVETAFRWHERQHTAA